MGYLGTVDKTELETLIGKVALGDRQAFSGLYDATSGKLFAVCVRVLKDRAAAEDAMQDAYLKIWKNAGRYQVTGYSPMTWLITIARNTAIDRLRMRQPEYDIDEHSATLHAPGPTPENAAVAASEVAQIMACLGELGTDRRAAVVGAYLDGQTYKELSAKFDVPLNTMRTWLRRSLASLRECLAR